MWNISPENTKKVLQLLTEAERIVRENSPTADSEKEVSQAYQESTSDSDIPHHIG